MGARNCHGMYLNIHLIYMFVKIHPFPRVRKLGICKCHCSIDSAAVEGGFISSNSNQTHLGGHTFFAPCQAQFYEAHLSYFEHFPAEVKHIQQLTMLDYQWLPCH